MNVNFKYDHTKSDFAESLGLPDDYDELISRKIGQLIKLLKTGKTPEDNGCTVSEIVEEMLAIFPDEFIAVLAATQIRDLLFEHEVAEYRNEKEDF